MKQLFKPVYNVDACLSRIRTVLETGWTGTGPLCTQFESDFADYIGRNKTDCLYLSSCTAALHIAVRLLNLKPGDKVATTPITFVSTNSVILHENLIPKFIDIDENTLSIDPDALYKTIESDKDIKAVIWVHYSGNVHNRFLEVVKYCKYRNIQIIEDCAHAMGSYYPNTHNRVGSLTDTMSCFSFQAVKNLPTFDSGMIVLNREQSRARSLSWLGIDKSTYSRTNDTDLYKWRYDCIENGWKYNANDIAAAIAIEQLKLLDANNGYRRKIFSRYKHNLDPSSIGVEGVSYLTKIFDHNSGSSFHFVEINVNNRDKVMGALKEKGYATGVHYLPNFYFDVYKKYYNGECPKAEKISDHIMTLPIHLEITIEDVDIICDTIKKTK